MTDAEYVPTTEEVQAAWRVALYPQGVTADDADPPFALWLAAQRAAAQREVVEWIATSGVRGPRERIVADARTHFALTQSGATDND